eukprot:1946044-Rhodomonas_salina.4
MLRQHPISRFCKHSAQFNTSKHLASTLCSRITFVAGRGCGSYLRGDSVRLPGHRLLLLLVPSHAHVSTTTSTLGHAS